MLGWLKRILGQRPAAHGALPSPGPAPASAPAPAFVYAEGELEGYVRQQVARDLAGGFMPPEEIVQAAVDCFEGEGEPEVVRAAALQGLDEARAARAAEQATWPEVTDCDRLDAAFAALEADGVIARHNFSCCGTCGSSEIWDEMAQVRDAGGAVAGYAFYHQQDTERAAEGGGLYLNYGAVEDGEAAAIAVGHRIVAGLRAQGLEPDWDGRIERRIGLPLDWKRRAPPA